MSSDISPDRQARALVVAGASAGGVEALRELVLGLPAELDAAVLVVLHMPRTAPSALAAILSRSAVLPAATAVDGDRLRSKHVYVAAVDRHLLVMDGRIRLSRGPTENGHRPAIDPLFRSAARAYRERVIGIVLSGSRDDGTAGLAAIVSEGGIALAEHPDDALYPSMPRSALKHIPECRAVPLTTLGNTVAELVAAFPRRNSPHPGSDLPPGETAMAAMEDVTTDQLAARPGGLACPACHGVLFELPGEPSPRYRCRVGHAWSPESLLDGQAHALDEALWTALRALKESSALNAKMAAGALERGRATSAETFESARAEAERASAIIRNLIERAGGEVNGEAVAP